MRTIRIQIRNDSVLLDGYVNAICRDSKPIPSERGKFVEQIMPKAFERALDNAENVDLLLNHDRTRKLGSTVEGNLELFEDNIGLRAICTITDPEIIEKARNKQLRGWSFGFYSNKDKWEETEEVTRRYVEDLDLIEVSIIDNTKSPAYIATSIESRNGEDVLSETRKGEESKIVTENAETEKEDQSSEQNQTDKTKEVEEKEDRKLDYSSYEREIEIIKLKGGN